MADKRLMVQRIGGNDSSAGSSSAQGPKRQEERSEQDRAAKFRSVLGKGQGQAKDGQQLDAAGAGRKTNPGAQLDGAGGPGRPGLGGAAGQPDGATGAATGRSGPGTASELAAAARELQNALDEMGMKAKPAADKEAAQTSDQGAFAAQLAAEMAPSWSRPEGPARVEAAARLMPTELEGMEKMHRLLIGHGPTGAEARLTITDGPLAGAAIHLRTGPGGVEAAVSTANSSSRQTLVTAMDEVARRMRDKGHRLSVKEAPPPTRPGHSGWSSGEPG
jgi:hypothetical protein